MRIVLLGAPGSGKGTQSQKLQSKYGVPQISSGDILRDAVARGTELGLQAKAIMDAGQLVSDDIVLGLIRDRLSRPDAADGFILDGFPRNIDQAKALEALLQELGTPLEAVLLLDVRRETLITRLAGRRVCPKCGTVYNVHSMPPGATGCSKDGAELQQRPDDKEEVVAKRLEVYEEQTRPLVDHYSRLGVLRVVAGEGELDEVFERMESAALARPIPADKVSVTKAKAGRGKPSAQSQKRPVKRTGASKRSTKKKVKAPKRAQRGVKKSNTKKSPAKKSRRPTGRSAARTTSARKASKKKTVRQARRTATPARKARSKK